MRVRSMTTMTSREFNRDVGKAKREARKGPVFITDRGRASHVLLTAEDFQEMTGAGASIAEWLAMPEAADIDFHPPRLEVMTKPADLA